MRSKWRILQFEIVVNEIQFNGRIQLEVPLKSLRYRQTSNFFYFVCRNENSSFFTFVLILIENGYIQILLRLVHYMVYFVQSDPFILNKWFCLIVTIYYTQEKINLAGSWCLLVVIVHTKKTLKMFVYTAMKLYTPLRMYNVKSSIWSFFFF